MSAEWPDCKVCLSPWIKEINHLLDQGTNRAAITRRIKGMRTGAIARGRMQATDVPEISYEMMKLHTERCVMKIGTSYIGAEDIVTPGKPPPPSVSAAELADPKKRLDLLREALAAKIGDLSADKLFQMYMAEVKLQTAQAERDAKTGPAMPPTPDDDDSLGDAIAQAAGHLPDLRVVSKAERRAAS